MRFSTFHCHTNFSDGKNSVEEMIQGAIARGFSSIGIADHGPIQIESECNMPWESFPSYEREIRELGEKYRKEISVFLGLECDWLKNRQKISFYDDYKTDYRIGSLHFLGYEDSWIAVDESPQTQSAAVNQFFNGDWSAFVCAYFQQVEEMTAAGGFQILGHLDLVKKFNGDGRFYDEEAAVYKPLVGRVLEAAADNKIAVEINTGAISRGWLKNPYPALWILKECRRRYLPIQINSDAHCVDGLDCFYPQALALAREAGYEGLPQGDWGLILK